MSEQTCERHGPKREEPLTRPDGKQIGTLTIWVCDACDDETDEDFEAFLDRVRSGDIPPVGSVQGSGEGAGE